MFILAWRNLWRNKRRTLITSASIFFAVMLAIFMRGFHVGTWDSLIDGVLHSYVGYIQVHKQGYWEDKSLDYSFELTDSINNISQCDKNIKQFIPRIESFALASIGNKTKGVLVSGVDPRAENSFSNLSGRLIQGEYLSDSSGGIILGQRLARFLKVQPNDTIVLLSQGYQGVSANGLFVVRGIVKLPAPEFDNMTIFMPLAKAQEFYSAPNRITSLVVDISSSLKMEKTAHKLNKAMPIGQFEVMTWKEMLKELYQMYISDNAGGAIMLSILYLIVGFGVFGTVLMMTAERRREFGIMIALGMRRGRIVRMVAMEMVYIGIMGLLAGLICSLPIVAYYHFYPIELTGDYAKTMEVYGMEPTIPMAWHSDYIINQAIAVGILVVVAICYPILALSKLDLVKAIRR